MKRLTEWIETLDKKQKKRVLYFLLIILVLEGVIIGMIVESIVEFDIVQRIQDASNWVLEELKK